ncbi:MAG TPA: hypothetical protein VKZ41_06090 [Gemmatimonadales bacterium]|nr:hypothetical protein [Gemmatimonadales bacterium]
MFELIGLMALGALVYGGYSATRRFVRDRLRYVDAVQKRFTPWLAGVAATTVLLPVTWLLPFVGLGTAMLVGVSVGVGVARGAADVRKRNGGGDGWTALPRI